MRTPTRAGLAWRGRTPGHIDLDQPAYPIGAELPGVDHAADGALVHVQELCSGTDGYEPGRSARGALRRLVVAVGIAVSPQRREQRQTHHTCLRCSALDARPYLVRLPEPHLPVRYGRERPRGHAARRAARAVGGSDPFPGLRSNVDTARSLAPACHRGRGQCYTARGSSRGSGRSCSRHLSGPVVPVTRR